MKPFWKSWSGNTPSEPPAEAAGEPASVQPTGRPSFGRTAAKRKELAEKLLNKDGEIRLSWAAGGASTSGWANLGDGLSAFMVANLAQLPVRITGFESAQTRLFGVGSIGHGAKNGHAVIWGTGCYRPDILIENVKCTTYDILAVRGNISQHCLESVGIPASHCYGEPVWLLPSMFNEPVEKKYELGFISHISDLATQGPDAAIKEDWAAFKIPDDMKDSVVMIHTWHPRDLNGLLDKLRLILSCKRIASRSFHGMVIAEAYGIPNVSISSSPSLPKGAFTAEGVKPESLDKRALEFLNSGQRRPQYFYGQRRVSPTDWPHLIQTIDRIWSPIGYDASPMLEAFPFDIPIDPLTNSIPLHSSLTHQSF